MSNNRILVINIVVVIIVLVVGVVPSVMAGSQSLQPPMDLGTEGKSIPYSGRLTSDDGESVLDGNFAFSFSLYDSEIGGIPLWSELQEGVWVAGGELSTLLGTANPIPPTVLQGNQELWLAVGIRGPGEAGFTVLTPRQGLSLEAASDPDASTSAMACPHDHLYENWVGFDALKSFSVTNSSTGDAIWATAQGTGAGLSGLSHDGPGVTGSSDNGRGVEGSSTSANEWAPAVYGSHDGAGDGVYGVSQNRYGVYGVTKVADAAGVYARNDDGGAAIHSDGDLYVTGAYRGDLGAIGGAPFPRPAWDSGWHNIPIDCVTKSHNLGGDPEDYFIDLHFRWQDTGRITNSGLGGDSHWWDFGQEMAFHGAYYHDLTNQQIDVCRDSEYVSPMDFRIRIWIIN